jgi:hypothetical protein
MQKNTEFPLFNRLKPKKHKSREMGTRLGTGQSANVNLNQFAANMAKAKDNNAAKRITLGRCVWLPPLTRHIA